MAPIGNTDILLATSGSTMAMLFVIGLGLALLQFHLGRLLLGMLEDVEPSPGEGDTTRRCPHREPTPQGDDTKGRRLFF